MPTLYIAGDSTAAQKGADQKPMTGWENIFRAISARKSPWTTAQLTDGAPNHISSKDGSRILNRISSPVIIC